MQNSTHKNTVNSYTSLPIPLSEELRTNYTSDLKKVAMTSYNDAHTLAYGDERLNKAGMFAQADLAGMLSLPMLSGSRESLGDPASFLIQLSGGFFLLVGISWLIAAPLAGYLMYNWLQQYEYRVDIPLSIFGISLLPALAIAMLTVSYQTIRAARVNPVESLRMK